MRTLKLTKDSQKNILESLLKRSPNNYTEYESTVNEIINNVKENRDKAVFEYTKIWLLSLRLTIRLLTLLIIIVWKRLLTVMKDLFRLITLSPL